MLTIRLSRIGKRAQISYRLIISEKARDTYGKSLEILGSYNPNTKKLVAKKDRIEHWIRKGSGMSTTVNNLLVKDGIIEGKKIRKNKHKQEEIKEEAKDEPKSANNTEKPAEKATEEAGKDTDKPAK